MSNFQNVPGSGIPTELNFSDLPAAMVASRKYEMRVQPYGQSTFNTPGQAIRMVLPQLQRTVYQTQTGYLFGTVSFTHAGVVNTDYSYLLSSWYSLFTRQVIRAGSGYVLETIDRPAELVNAITSMTINEADKACLNNTFGFNDDHPASNLGVKMNITPIVGPAGSNELNFSFSLPLIGVLNSSKFWPAWNNNDLEIELTLSNIASFIASYTNNTVTSFTLSNVEYVVEALELSPESYNMVMANNPNQVVLKTQTYTYGSSALTAGQGAGSIDIPFQIKVNSLKQLIWYSQPANAAEKSFAGVNPNLDNWQFIVNGQSYPQRPVQAKYPSEAFSQNLKSFGSMYSTSHSGVASRRQFNAASTAYNNYHRAYNSLVDSIEELPNKWYQCLDLETINSNKESLFSGITTNGTTSTIRLNILSPLAAQSHNIHYWSCQDLLVVMDLVSGITSVVV